MGKATIAPELQARVNRASWWTRFKFHRVLNNYLRACDQRDALFDRYDCGADLINYLTGGQMDAINRVIDERVNRLQAIINSLPEA